MERSENIFVRVNGRGNAWPVFLGDSSKFYNANSSDDLASASYSVISASEKEENLSPETINWEILIDAGHHTAPFLIKNCNRIPEAIILTHGHMDHTLGIDWIAQSRYYMSGKKAKLPLYSTISVWEFVVQSYPHLKNIIEFTELLPGKKTVIKEVKELFVTAFPVFHGENAAGASMLLIEANKTKQVLFTGDMLCPLLRKKDFKTLANAKAVYIDSNNRYPYPSSNHGSITSNDPSTGKVSEFLIDWQQKVSFSYLTAPHARRKYNTHHHGYFHELQQEFKSAGQYPLSIIQFIQAIDISTIFLVHYGGMEDNEFYGLNPMSAEDLELCTSDLFKVTNLTNHKVMVPETGSIFKL